MEQLRKIDFWDNDYDLSMAFYTKGTSSHLSLSKRDKAAMVTRDEIINALSYGMIGLANGANERYEQVIKDILSRCIEIEEEQKAMR